MAYRRLIRGRFSAEEIQCQQNERDPDGISQQKVPELHNYRAQCQQRERPERKLQNCERRQNAAPAYYRRLSFQPVSQPSGPENEKYDRHDGNDRVQRS
jgi:hypothetical protein